MKQGLTDKVYFLIKKEIANGQRDIDEFIIEQQIANQYGVSKGTASEALHRMCMEGDLISYPRKGYRIAVLDSKDHQKIQRLRLAIESLVLQILIEKKEEKELGRLYHILEDQNWEDKGYFTRNTYFHMSMAELTGDQFIQKTLKDLLNALSRTIIYFEVIRDKDTVSDYHKDIIEQIIKNDIDKAIYYLKLDLKFTYNFKLSIS